MIDAKSSHPHRVGCFFAFGGMRGRRNFCTWHQMAIWCQVQKGDMVPGTKRGYGARYKKGERCQAQKRQKVPGTTTPRTTHHNKKNTRQPGGCSSITVLHKDRIQSLHVESLPVQGPYLLRFHHRFRYHPLFHHTFRIHR